MSVDDWAILSQAIEQFYSKEDYMWKGSDPGQCRTRAEYLYKRFKPSTAIELGAARCNTAKELRLLGCEAVALDISQLVGMFSKPTRVQGVQASVSHMPFRDNSFDLVVGFDVLEHQPGELRDMSIREVQRIAGKFIALNIPMGDKSGVGHEEIHHPSGDFTRDWWLERFTGCKDLGMVTEAGNIGFAHGHEKSLLFLEKLVQ